MQQRVRDEGGDRDEVVEDGGEHGRSEAAFGVEQSAGDRPDPVEDDLRHEPPEQEHAELDLRRRSAASEAARYSRMICGASAMPSDGERGEQHEREREHAGPEVERGLASVRSAVVDEDRHEHRGEHPAEDQLVHDVRRGVGLHVDVAERSHRDAQRRRLRSDAHVAGQARQGRTRRHQGGVAHVGLYGLGRRTNLLDHSSTSATPAPIVVHSATALTAVVRTVRFWSSPMSRPDGARSLTLIV